MAQYVDRLIEDLEILSLGYDISVEDNGERIIIHNFKLPPGYNYNTTEVLIMIPDDYPVKPPGIGSDRIYLPADLRFHGKKLDEFRDHHDPDLGDWGWFCFENIDWDMTRDDLNSLMEIIRTNLTNPPTQ
ncbi:MAG TPA: E2/UBC family protein [Anaerohalosphaeraceae bacterium]|nr:E2/UBC family protein [Anaerohalosphaeraceae bacterium]